MPTTSIADRAEVADHAPVEEPIRPLADYLDYEPDLGFADWRVHCLSLLAAAA